MELVDWMRQGGDYLLVVCAAVAVVCTAAQWAWRVAKAASKPREDIEAKLDGAIAQHGHFDECLRRDKRRLDGIEESEKLMLRALMQLITHELDGNHVDKLAEVRDAIQDHLIER